MDLIERIEAHWDSVKMVYGEIRHAICKDTMRDLKKEILVKVRQAMRDGKTKEWCQILPIAQYNKNSTLCPVFHNIAMTSLTGQPPMFGIKSLDLPEDRVLHLERERDLKRLLKDLDIHYDDYNEADEQSSDESENSTDGDEDAKQDDASFNNTNTESLPSLADMIRSSQMNPATQPKKSTTQTGFKDAHCGSKLEMRKPETIVIEDSTTNEKSMEQFVHPFPKNDNSVTHVKKGEVQLKTKKTQSTSAKKVNLFDTALKYPNQENEDRRTKALATKLMQKKEIVGIGQCITCLNITTFKCEGICGNFVHRKNECAKQFLRNGVLTSMCDVCVLQERVWCTVTDKKT